MRVWISLRHKWFSGESALHIAVMLDDLDIVQLLVQNGASVNQRATGRFFLPEDLKKNPDPTAATNYDGKFYSICSSSL